MTLKELIRKLDSTEFSPKTADLPKPKIRARSAEAVMLKREGLDWSQETFDPEAVSEWVKAQKVVPGEVE